jgi:predicted amidophosphoribosyltransferase
MAETPRRDDRATTASPTEPGQRLPQLLCPVCWSPFTKIGRQLYCTQTCRKTAWKRRNATPVEPAEPVVPQGVRRLDVTIYECPTCETRYHGEQWCHDCNQPCTRVGLGGLCPHCDQPVAISDLIDTLTTSNIR